MALDPKLLEILACPACKSDVEYREKENKIYCTNTECGLIYPVRDDIPVMLVEEAEKANA